MISIITATYNAAATLQDNLACIRRQTQNAGCEAGPQVEHLLIDGGSRDGCLESIKAYCADSGRFVCSSPQARFISEPDHGIYDAMNKGIKLAQGEIIGILNADDCYADDTVLAQVAAVFADPEVEACYGDLEYVAADDMARVIRYWQSGVYDAKKFYLGWMPPHPTFFVRRRVYEQFGMFNLNMGTAADYELMLRFLFKHRLRVAYIPKVLVKMRVGGMSNVSLKNRLAANRMDRKAWAVNGLRPYPWTLWMKPLRKVLQWVVKKDSGVSV
jgi:glycosyltransferase